MKRTPLKRGSGFKKKGGPLKRSRPSVSDLLKTGLVKKAKRLPFRSDTPLAKLDARLVELHSRYIRTRAMKQGGGVIKCFICGVEIHDIDDAVNMHFQPRKERGTRFSDIACQAGCSSCNGKPNGDRRNYATRLDAMYGPGTADEMTRLSKQVTILDRAWYEEQISKYEELLAS